MPKCGGGKRTLGMQKITDIIVQTVAKFHLEPLIELILQGSTMDTSQETLKKIQFQRQGDDVGVVKGYWYST